MNKIISVPPGCSRILLSKHGIMSFAAGCALWLASTVGSQAQQDIFMKFTGGSSPAPPTISGDSTDANYPGSAGWFKVSQFSFGVTNPVTIGSASSGGSAGRVHFVGASIDKAVNISSPALFRAACLGSHYDKATLVVRAPGTVNNQAYLVYDFGLVYISTQTFNASASDENVNENVRLEYGSMRIAYASLQNGVLGPGATNQWNQVYNDETFVTSTPP